MIGGHPEPKFQLGQQVEVPISTVVKGVLLEGTWKPFIVNIELCVEEHTGGCTWYYKYALTNAVGSTKDASIYNENNLLKYNKMPRE